MPIDEINFRIDREKSIAVMLYILNDLQHSDIHKLFKIIYFADQNHLVRFGRPITGDWYVAMKDGPVPSRIYDYIKIIRGELEYPDTELKNKFEIRDWFCIYPKEKSDLDELTKAEIECLNNSISENKNLGYNELVEKSHDEAYEKADRNNMIKFEDIAIAAGANEELLKYIRATLQNNRIATSGKLQQCSCSMG